MKSAIFMKIHALIYGLLSNPNTQPKSAKIKTAHTYSRSINIFNKKLTNKNALTESPLLLSVSFAVAA